MRHVRKENDSVRHHVRVIAALGLAAAGSACDGDNRPFVRYSLGDTVVIENRRPLRPDTLLPIEKYRFGRAEGPPEYLIDQVYAFAVDERGAVFVNDRTGGIRQFNAEGEFVQLVAPPGRGPGEIQLAAALAAASGIVAANDVGNRRISIFGLPSGPWGVRMPDGVPPFREGIDFRADGSLWVAVNPIFPPSGGIPHPRAVYARIREDGMLVDTVFTPKGAAEDCPVLSDARHQRGYWEDERDPFVPKVKWAMGSDGSLVVGCPTAYRFEIHRPDGRVTSVAKEWHPLSVSREERAFRSRMPVPEAGPTLPAYARIVVSGDGYIWIWPRQPSFKEPLPPEAIERFGVEYTWSLPTTGAFDVFGPDGRWLAVVRMPPSSRFSGYPTEPGIVIRGDTLWAVAQDSLDVQYIVRYEVPGVRNRR